MGGSSRRWGMKPSAPREARIRRLIREHSRTLRLWDWTLAATFPPEMKDRANCSASPEYQEAVMEFNLARIAPQEERDMVLHEMGHCMVEDLASLAVTLAKEDPAALEWIRRAEERLTSHIQRVVSGLLDA